MLYFAYGSNMCAAQMAVRCPRARFVERGVLRDYRFIIMKRGYATVVPEAGACVHGVLWELTAACKAALDRYEGVQSGLYSVQQAVVEREGGGQAAVLVHVARDTAPGKPNPGYLEKLLAAAGAHGLPAGYHRELAAWGG